MSYETLKQVKACLIRVSLIVRNSRKNQRDKKHLLFMINCWLPVLVLREYNSKHTTHYNKLPIGYRMKIYTLNSF